MIWFNIFMARTRPPRFCHVTVSVLCSGTDPKVHTKPPAISGVVVTESVFNIPGLGRLVVEAVLARDYPVIQGLTLFFAFVYVFINLVVDCAYTVFDPRIRY